MHDLLLDPFSLSFALQWVLLLATLAAFAARGFKLNLTRWGTYTFTNAYHINDTEEWEVVSELADTTGVITFKNPDFLLAPRIHIVPTAQSSYLNQFRVSAKTAVDCTIAQTVSIGAGACRVIVERRR